MKLPETLPHHWAGPEGHAVATVYADRSREQQAMPHMSDFALANAVYMASGGSPMLIAYQTAAKERIRWLSVQLAIKEAELAALKGAPAGEAPQLVIAVRGGMVDALYGYALPEVEIYIADRDDDCSDKITLHRAPKGHHTIPPAPLTIRCDLGDEAVQKLVAPVETETADLDGNDEGPTA